MAKKDKKLVATVLYPGMTALDLVGSSQALMGLDTKSPYRTVKVAEHLAPIQTDTPLQVVPNQTFHEVPAPFCLIVPGGEAAIAVAKSGALLHYVQTAAHTAELVVSIGAGSLILAKAGLLEGRRATTHWAHAGQLEEYGVRYVRQRWVEDGKFYTAAGVTAGIDLALFLMAKLTSVTKARNMQLWIEYEPQPPFGGIDWDRIDPSGSNGVSVDEMLSTSSRTKERV